MRGFLPACAVSASVTFSSRMTCAMRSAVSAATFSGVRRKRLTVILVTPANCAMSCSVTRGCFIRWPSRAVRQGRMAVC